MYASWQGTGGTFDELLEGRTYTLKVQKVATINNGSLPGALLIFDWV
jgi:hypothetical protein